MLLSISPLLIRAQDSTSEAPDIIHTYWISHSECIFRRVDIYLPAEYDTCTQALPVLYLLHGINGCELSWQYKGSAVDTLISLIAQKRCKPMILVMPDCNKWPFKKRPLDPTNLWKCVLNYSKLTHEHRIEYAISDLMDMIDTTYCVAECSVAGLSDGARMAANLANLLPDRIKNVGLFSPVLYKDQLPKYPFDSCLQQPYYYIYVGSKDMFYRNGKRFHKRMCRINYPHEWIVWPETHDWRMWRKCIADFLEKL